MDAFAFTGFSHSKQYMSLQHTSTSATFLTVSSRSEEMPWTGIVFPCIARVGRVGKTKQGSRKWGCNFIVALPPAKMCIGSVILCSPV